MLDELNISSAIGVLAIGPELLALVPRSHANTIRVWRLRSGVHDGRRPNVSRSGGGRTSSLSRNELVGVTANGTGASPPVWHGVSCPIRHRFPSHQRHPSSSSPSPAPSHPHRHSISHIPSLTPSQPHPITHPIIHIPFHPPHPPLPTSHPIISASPITHLISASFSLTSLKSIAVDALSLSGPASLVFASSGRGQTCVQVWDLRMRHPQIVASLSGHVSPVIAIWAYGGRIASGDKAGKIRFWEQRVQLE